MAKMFDVLVRNSKDEIVDSIRCSENSCTIGKASDNTLILNGWWVASYHAEIHRTKEGLFVEDRTGRGKLEVNGDPVERYGPLGSKDIIDIGGYQITAGEGHKRSEEGLQKLDRDAEAEEIDTVKTVMFHASEYLGKAAKEGDAGADPLAGVSPEDTIVRKIALAEKYKWRNRVQDELLKMMDLRRTDISSMDEKKLRTHVEGMIVEIVRSMEEHLPQEVDREKLKKDVLDEAIGLGPLEELLAMDSVSEIMVNKHDDIYVEQGGRLSRSDVTFSSDAAVMSAIERIVSPLGRRIDESSPMVDARLKDGSRVNAIIPPLALRGPCLTIRKFSKNKLTSDDLVGFGAVSVPMVEFLQMAVEQRLNIIISGGTGSGKTTLLNVLSNFIPPNERIVTVEDAAELQLNQPHIVSLEARPPNLEGKGEVSIRELVKNCLRMRPDRIVVGECRGGEALDMLQAMNTGHDGSLTTAHANTPRDLISRLEVLVMMSGMDLPVQAIREQVASAVDMVVQQTRFSDGSRRIVSISEVTGVEQSIVQMQDIFRYVQEGFDSEGKVRGYFESTGSIPVFYEDLRARGIPVNMSIFDEAQTA